MPAGTQRVAVHRQAEKRVGLLTKVKQQPVRPKHVPQRTCIACRRVAGKRSLIRLVRTTQGVEVDITGKKAGRGMYLHPNQQCWQSALKGGRIEQALKTKLSADNRKELLAFMQSLPESEELPDGATSTGAATKNETP